VAGGVSPALVPVVGSICTDGGGQRLAENDGAVGLFGGNHVGRGLAHHSYHVQRAVDLRERTNLRVTMGFEIPNYIDIKNVYAKMMGEGMIRE
jgi:hypothetical protein